MNGNHDPMLLRAAQAQAAEAQANAVLQAKLESTAVQIYAHLAAMEFHKAQHSAVHEADPLGVADGPLDVKVEIDNDRLMNAAGFAKHAAVAAFIAWGKITVKENT